MDVGVCLRIGLGLGLLPKVSYKICFVIKKKKNQQLQRFLVSAMCFIKYENIKHLGESDITVSNYMNF